MSTASFLSPLVSSWVSPSQKRIVVRSNHVSPFRPSASALQVTSLDQFAVPDAEAATVAEPGEEGTIVARFPGGLTAVRLTDGDAVEGYHPSMFAAIKQAAPKPSQGAASTSYDMQGRRVTFSDGSSGVVVAHRPPVVFVFSDEELSTEIGGTAKVHGDAATISMSTSSSVVNLFGRPLDGSVAAAKGEEGTMTRGVFAPIPQIKDIALINHPMLSGVTMIDTLAPIGKGQNMLVIGNDLTSTRGYALDCLETQIRDGKVKVVYATTHDETETLAKLKERGIDESVHLVAPTRKEKDEASQAAEAVAIASAACSIAEMYALEQGLDTLVVVDTIDMHKDFWDVTTRVLVDVYGIDAVVQADRTGGASSEMRGFFSTLIQRSAQYKESRGGGSVTLILLVSIPVADASENTVFSEDDFADSPAKIKERIKLLTSRNIPLTAANLRKVEIPIPSEGSRLMALQHVDDLISMSDGQIWMDERLEAQGQWPPMNAQRSVTRIGIGADTNSRADAPALRRLDSRFRLELSQASNMVGADETTATIRQIQRRDALLLSMHQKPGSGSRRLSESCVALLAATTGRLDSVVAAGVKPGSTEGTQVIQRLMDHVLLSAPDAIAGIDKSLDLSDEAKEQILSALDSYTIDE